MTKVCSRGPDSWLDENARGQLADDLGTFLRCLHGLSVPQIDGLPVDPMGRADMAIRVPRTRTALDELDASGALTSRAADVLTAAETLPTADESVFVHGDLRLRHTLIDDAGRLSGVIDWGDVCRAPPARRRPNIAKERHGTPSAVPGDLTPLDHQTRASAPAPVISQRRTRLVAIGLGRSGSGHIVKAIHGGRGFGARQGARRRRWDVMVAEWTDQVTW